jgi:hypothetical protein
MSNALYDHGRQKFLEGSIAYLTDNIKLAFVDSAVYTPNLASDTFFNAIASTIAISGNFATKTSAAGVADADDVVVTSVSGAQFEYVVIYKDTGVSSTSPLIALIDTATGLPFTPTGNNITVAWDNGANKIWKL